MHPAAGTVYLLSACPGPARPIPVHRCRASGWPSTWHGSAPLPGPRRHRAGGWKFRLGPHRAGKHGSTSQVTGAWEYHHGPSVGAQRRRTPRRRPDEPDDGDIQQRPVVSPDARLTIPERAPEDAIRRCTMNSPRNTPNPGRHAAPDSGYSDHGGCPRFSTCPVCEPPSVEHDESK